MTTSRCPDCGINVNRNPGIDSSVCPHCDSIKREGPIQEIRERWIKEIEYSEERMNGNPSMAMEWLDRMDLMECFLADLLKLEKGKK